MPGDESAHDMVNLKMLSPRRIMVHFKVLGKFQVHLHMAAFKACDTTRRYSADWVEGLIR